MRKYPFKISWIISLAAVGVLAVLAVWWSIHPQDSAEMENISGIHEAKAAKPISPAVLALLSQEAHPLNERLNALRIAGYSLPHGDRLALLRSLTAPKLPGLSDDDWFTLANDIMQLLRSQQPATPELTPALLALWNDPQINPTLRDYALQHLREWLGDKDVRSAHETNPAQIQKIQKTFLDVIDPASPTYDPQSTSLGTALLALHEWHHKEHPHPMRDTSFEERLLALIADSTVHRGIRTTALQIAAQRKMTSTLPIARQLLQQANSPMILRLAAISFLGSNGSPDDKDFLLTFQQQHANDTLLQSSLTKALQTLNTPSY